MATNERRRRKSDEQSQSFHLKPTQQQDDRDRDRDEERMAVNPFFQSQFEDDSADIFNPFSGEAGRSEGQTNTSTPVRKRMNTSSEVDDDFKPLHDLGQAASPSHASSSSSSYSPSSSSSSSLYVGGYDALQTAAFDELEISGLDGLPISVRVVEAVTTAPDVGKMYTVSPKPLLQSFNPSILQSFNPSILHSFNPSILQSFNPSILQSFNPSLISISISLSIIDVARNITLRSNRQEVLWEAIRSSPGQPTGSQRSSNSTLMSVPPFSPSPFPL